MVLLLKAKISTHGNYVRKLLTPCLGKKKKIEKISSSNVLIKTLCFRLRLKSSTEAMISIY